jgi:hypothetical protein
MKKEITTVHHICDRCNDEFEHTGELIEQMSYAHSYYGRDSGGSTVSGQDLCQKCTTSFLLWLNNPAYVAKL